MSALRHLLGRLLFTVFALYLVISLMFAILVVTPDAQLQTKLGMAALGGTDQETLDKIRERYLERRGRDAPLHERYLDWLVDITLLDWGNSPNSGRLVKEMVFEGVIRTATYVLPAALLAVVGGVGLGMFSAVREGGVSERAGRVVAYLLQGVPAFWLAVVGLAVLFPEVGAYGPETRAPNDPLATYVLPVVVLAPALLASMVSFSRSEARSVVARPFVRTLRAKGLSSGAISVRVLRNVAVPLVSLSVAQVTDVLLLNVFVLEIVFGIEGIGNLLYVGVADHDFPVIIGATTAVFVLIAVAGFVEDVAHVALNPKIRLVE